MPGTNEIAPSRPLLILRSAQALQLRHSSRLHPRHSRPPPLGPRLGHSSRRRRFRPLPRLRRPLRRDRDRRSWQGQPLGRDEPWTEARRPTSGSSGFRSALLRRVFGEAATAVQLLRQESRRTTPIPSCRKPRPSLPLHAFHLRSHRSRYPSRFDLEARHHRTLVFGAERDFVGGAKLFRSKGEGEGNAREREGRFGRSAEYLELLQASAKAQVARQEEEGEEGRRSRLSIYDGVQHLAGIDIFLRRRPHRRVGRTIGRDGSERLRDCLFGIVSRLGVVGLVESVRAEGATELRWAWRAVEGVDGQQAGDQQGSALLPLCEARLSCMHSAARGADHVVVEQARRTWLRQGTG